MSDSQHQLHQRDVEGRKLCQMLHSIGSRSSEKGHDSLATNNLWYETRGRESMDVFHHEQKNREDQIPRGSKRGRLGMD